MLFCITTQYKENYGTEEDPYWKYKGSDDYLVEVPGFNFDGDLAFKKGEILVDQMRTKIEYKNDYTEEYIINWGFVPDDYKTEFEMTQLEFDKEILYPAKRMTYDELMEKTSECI
jgi:hypothetical protein